MNKPILKILALTLVVLFAGQNLAVADSGQGFLDRLLQRHFSPIPEARMPLKQAQDPAVARLLERIQNRFSQVRAVQADFSQTAASPYHHGAQTVNGHLVLRGTQYRVETPDQTIVTDGRTTWVHMKHDRQVLINNYVEDETTFSINDFFFNFADNYNVRRVEPVTLEGQRHFRMHLTPRQQDSFFQEATIWLRDRDTMITRVQVLDANETTMTFNLRNVVLNPTLDGSTFSFTPPRGSEIVDLR
jgi:outer membrane lipoprotein carrier protein